MSMFVMREPQNFYEVFQLAKYGNILLIEAEEGEVLDGSQGETIFTEQRPEREMKVHADHVGRQARYWGNESLQFL